MIFANKLNVKLLCIIYIFSFSSLSHANRDTQFDGQWNLIAFSMNEPLSFEDLQNDSSLALKRGVNAVLNVNKSHFKYSKVKNDNCSDLDMSVFQNDEYDFCGLMPFSNSGNIAFNEDGTAVLNTTESEMISLDPGGHMRVIFGLNNESTTYFWRFLGHILEVQVNDKEDHEIHNRYYYFAKQSMLLF